MTSCEICGRKTPEIYCSYHQKAYQNLKTAFEAWQSALEIEWLDYLRSVLTTEEAGLWVREVIEHLFSEDSPSE